VSLLSDDASQSVDGLAESAVDLGESKESAKPTLTKLLGKIATTKKAGPIVPRHGDKEFSIIPNFVVPGVVQNVKTREQCAEHCITRKQCRSYSYKPSNSKCYWSTGSLRYSHQWTFYSKEFDMNAFGKIVPTQDYFKFPGLFSVDVENNVETLTDKSADDCEDVCNSDPKCMSFSFHELDHACLMSKSKVRYAKGWDYYERNQEPKKEGDEWLPYPMGLDAYSSKMKREEDAALRLFAEKARKKRISRQKKEGVVKYKMKHMEKKRKRLDKEMKLKAYHREQSKKRILALRKKHKAQREAASEKGKFDEAFHKQSHVNGELLHKRRVERSVKVHFMKRMKERGVKQDSKLKAKLSAMKKRGMREMEAKDRVIAAKEKEQKLKLGMQASDMKVAAFKLVGDERKFKSHASTNIRKKASKKVQNTERRKQWDQIDETNKAIAKEKETKRQIKMEKMSQALQLKLSKEKASKKPPPSDIPAGALKTDAKPKLPRKIKDPKPAKLPNTAPGNNKNKMNAPKTPKLA